MAYSGGWKGPTTYLPTPGVVTLRTPNEVGRQILNEKAMEDLLLATDHNSIYNALDDKGFTSVCPDGVNVSLTRDNEVLREKPWFEKRIVNQLWVQEIKKAHRWTNTLGFFVVTYEVTNEIFNEVVPHVLDPRVYTLLWTTDYNGVRKYFIQLKRGIASHVLHAVGGLNSKYDIFFMSPPSEDGQVNSKARSCLDELIDINGIMRAHKIALANNSSTPFVLEHQPEKYPTEDRTPRNCGMPDAAMRTDEEDLGITGMKFGAVKDMKDVVQRDAMDRTFTEASSRAAVTVIRHVDVRNGTVMNIPHLRPWENAPIVLPEGSRLAAVQQSELPKETIDILNAKIAIVCSLMGIPMEFLLGQTRSRVSTSTFAEEQLQSTVKAMRKFLQDSMVQMYWRIYWPSHAEDSIVRAANVTTHVMSQSEIEHMLNSVDVVFTFRSERINYEQARVLFGDGTMNGDALKRIAMETYCLKSSDMEKGEPTVGREQLLLAEQAAAAAAADGESGGGEKKKVAGKRPRPGPTSASSRVDSGKDIGFEGTEHGEKKRRLEGDAIAAVK